MTIVLLILTLLQGVTLRGTVWEADKPAANARVTIVGDGETLQTTSAEDGTFRFSLARPGYFELSARRGKSVGRPSTLFVGRDMDGVGVVLKPSVNPFVLGSVKVEGDGPLPTPLPRIVIKYPSGTEAGRFDINDRGMFFFPVTPVEFTVTLENLKEPYFVRSMTAADVDLMKNPLKLQDTASVNTISIMLGIRK